MLYTIITFLQGVQMSSKLSFSNVFTGKEDEDPAIIEEQPEEPEEK